jgi:molybdenum cofactor biosynthesis enzyme MoaA
MKLEDIGFYTLSDKRAREVDWESNLQRCELILTDRCNFNCAYCRGIKKEYRGDISFEQAKEIIDIWTSGKLKNIRFSGGEPTLWPGLLNLVKYTKQTNKYIEHIALSTNGSASHKYYLKLYHAGINDFSISLDACCATTADMMAGTKSKFDHISSIIYLLSRLTYVTVGVVLNENNLSELKGIIEYASKIGVSDIRIIPSAQYNKITALDFKTEYKILDYRLNNLKEGNHLRGLKDTDCNKCHLVKDDMAILYGKHFPCIIYMREQGNPIGNVYGKTLEEIRKERKKWFNKTDIQKNIICKNNCLDVCIDYNNRVNNYEILNTSIR